MREDQYYLAFAAAFVRGKLDNLPEELSRPLLEELSGEQQNELFELGLKAGLRLHRYKRSSLLPRVRKIIGALQSFGPERLLDLGTGRGVFLWPLLDEIPYLKVSCVDVLDYRVEDLLAVERGGVDRIQAVCADLTALPFADGQFPVTTMLEVLEHVPQTLAALREVARVTSNTLLLSVPSKPDDNPEHIHLFDARQLESWLGQVGFTRIKLDGVLNHTVVVASKGEAA